MAYLISPTKDGAVLMAANNLLVANTPTYTGNFVVTGVVNTGGGGGTGQQYTYGYAS